jgi:hypothetical protein
LIRGVTKPFPGAFCFKQGSEDKIFIWNAKPFDGIMDFSDYEVGEIIDIFDDRLIIRTIDGSLIVNQYFDPETENGLIVKVDIGDYRRRRDENLEKMATRIAKEVAKTKVPVKLNYMNAYERKVIHNKLSTWRDVTTHSEGVEPQRYLIIEPKNKAK